LPEKTLLDLAPHITTHSPPVEALTHSWRFLAHPMFDGQTLHWRLRDSEMHLEELQLLGHLVGPQKRFQRLVLRADAACTREHGEAHQTYDYIEALIDNPETAPEVLDIHGVPEIHFRACSLFYDVVARQSELRELVVNLDFEYLQVLATALRSPSNRLVRLCIYDKDLSDPEHSVEETGRRWAFFMALAGNKTLTDLELFGTPDHWETTRKIPRLLMYAEQSADVARETWTHLVGRENQVLERIRFQGFTYPVVEIASDAPVLFKWEDLNEKFQDKQDDLARKNHLELYYDEKSNLELLMCEGFLLRNRLAKAIGQLFLMYSMCRLAEAAHLDAKPLARVLFAMHGCPLPCVIAGATDEKNIACDLTTPTGAEKLASRFAILNSVQRAIARAIQWRRTVAEQKMNQKRKAPG
jgi:hypothetical protein